MFRLPHERKSYLQILLLAVLLVLVYLGARYVSNRIIARTESLGLRPAVNSGDTEEVRRILTLDADPDFRYDQETKTPLHFAVSYGHLEIAKLLLEHGADPNFASTDVGDTPLHAAAYKNAAMVKLLLDYGANPDLLTNGTNTAPTSPLHHAAGSGNIEVVKLLVEHGAPIHTMLGTPWQWPGSPAANALISHQPEIANYLLFDAGGGDLSDEDVDQLLWAAAYAGQAELVQTFIDAGADPGIATTWHQWPLRAAVMSRSVKTVRVLLDRGTDPSEFNTGILPFAIETLNESKQSYMPPEAEPNAQAVLDLLVEYRFKSPVDSSATQ